MVGESELCNACQRKKVIVNIAAALTHCTLATRRPVYAAAAYPLTIFRFSGGGALLLHFVID